MRYPQRLRITRAVAGGGVQDPETGTMPDPPPRLVLYDGLADVQDAGESLPRTATGQPVKVADATAFLEDEEAGLAIEPDDVAEVFYLGTDRTAEGEVKFVREMDGAVLLKYR